MCEGELGSVVDAVVQQQISLIARQKVIAIFIRVQAIRQHNLFCSGISKEDTGTAVCHGCFVFHHPICPFRHRSDIVRFFGVVKRQCREQARDGWKEGVVIDEGQVFPRLPRRVGVKNFNEVDVTARHVQILV